MNRTSTGYPSPAGGGWPPQAVGWGELVRDHCVLLVVTRTPPGSLSLATLPLPGRDDSLHA
jgi:hypothetical protein